MKKLFLIAFIQLLSTAYLISQDPQRFVNEIDIFEKINISEGEELVVFTGSSSVRLWEYLDKDCNETTVVNTGFGGSHMSDLLFFLDQTVLRFKPSKVYIYEGDNDIAAEKAPEEVLNTTKQVVKKILEALPTIEIHFISAKPSPSRWQYKDQYMAFNNLLKDYCYDNEQLFYIDVWNPMLDESRRPDPTIFIADSLHMNRKGYLLWKDIICGESN